MSKKSQVPEGYKRTELGVVPLEWEVVKQGDIVTFFNGRAYKLSEWEKKGTPVIRLQNLTGTGSEYYYSNLKLPSKQYVNHGDLLYMWSGSFGPHIWKGSRAIYHYHIWKIECGEKAHKLFMYYLLHNITDVMKSKMHGMAILHITKSGMENQKIPLPSFLEQQKIASFLSKVDEQIEQTEQIIEKTEILKKGLMQKMFTKGIGHTKFKKTELGEIPEEWEIRGLTKIFNIIDYRGRTPAFSDNGIPYIGADNIKDARIVFNKRRYVSEETYIEYMTRGIPNPGDILFTTEAPLGNVAQVPRYKFCFAQRVVVFQCKNNFSPLFFMYLLKNKIMQKQFLNWATGTTVTGISSKNMKFIKLYYPKSIQEQERIGQALKSVDKYIDLEKNKLSHLQELKKGLMQDLLTGKIRVCA